LGQISFTELAAMPLVIRAEKQGGSRTGMLIKKIRDRCGVEPNIVFRCGSPDAIKSAVRNGAGVGILVCDAVQDAASRNEFGVLSISGVSLAARTYILWPKGKRLSRAAQGFLALLRAWRRKNPPFGVAASTDSA
jgi:DNA-binding transcriptional LysR family regulator